MASIIPVKNVTNQSLNVVLNSQNCTINLLTRGGYTFMDLLLNNIGIIYGRKLTLTPVLPYKYMQSSFNGNFIIVNSDDNIDLNPDYKLFGISQYLVYYTSSDL